ncbi:MAG: hypothetical protein GXO26_02315 [Crenarchaeota archaeon]|nr:hypothetical protein [Thermoproteota archaeon]
MRIICRLSIVVLEDRPILYFKCSDGTVIRKVDNKIEKVSTREAICEICNRIENYIKTLEEKIRKLMLAETFNIEVRPLRKMLEEEVSRVRKVILDLVEGREVRDVKISNIVILCF